MSLDPIYPNPRTLATCRAEYADQGDARSVMIALTPLGQRLVKRRRKELAEAQRMLLSRMTPEGQQTFIQAFETIDQLARKAIPS